MSYNLDPHDPYRHDKVITIKSWNTPYLGCVKDVFISTLRRHMDRKNIYARSVPMIQSSGTGKSRLLDEVAKEIVVIPMNLRSGSQGYPPPDHDLRSWWSLFTLATDRIETIIQELSQPGEPPSLPQVAAEFRRRMMEGHDWNCHNEFRQSFYEEVTTGAESIVNGTSGWVDVLRSASKLVDLLDPTHVATGPLVILEFDEAKMLTEAHGRAAPYITPYSELQHALMDIVKLPIFALFLATGGDFHRISPRFGAWSWAPVWLPPYTELGWDIFARKVKLDGSTTLDTVATIEHMASLGRPLFATRYNEDSGGASRHDTVDFARLKLMRKVDFDAHMQLYDSTLPCFLVRLAIKFESTAGEASDTERNQVENHMRFCMVASPGFKQLITCAPSEPLLAVAAMEAMRIKTWMHQFPVAEGLLYHMERSGIIKGEHGELIAALVFMLAWDDAQAAHHTYTRDIHLVSVEEFLRSLLPADAVQTILSSTPSHLSDAKYTSTTFAEAFKDAKIYFTHYVKIDDFAVLSRKYLVGLITRGVAVMCPNNQRAVDIVIPFLYFDNRLQRTNVSAILVQVKNDASFTDTLRTSTFGFMDPYDVGIFEEDEPEPVPVICIVTALASPRPGVKVAGRRPHRTRLDKYTAWDIWIAGLSHETFVPIQQKENFVYQELLLHATRMPPELIPSRDEREGMPGLDAYTKLHFGHTDDEFLAGKVELVDEEDEWHDSDSEDEDDSDEQV
ncbi:hypothetical protein FA95DRAFT_1608076 [Auriscalpium vulgare]|uniref:Uncharacterized protein n=1 Tax=Auriscalpium vulgare TaxID=40419 RepID=A0ACB8RLI0_9AGAM|nr:hypothetical protein FA95DRAFT_1608076 [Auriscalpium vulgare]